MPQKNNSNIPSNSGINQKCNGTSININNYYTNDIFSNIIQGQNNIIMYIFIKCGICINNEIIAFTSNKVVSKGKDKIFFYIISSKNIVCSEKEYSFTLSLNGMIVMPDQRETKKRIMENNKALLCACKKYIKNQKNGIFLSNSFGFGLYEK